MSAPTEVLALARHDSFSADDVPGLALEYTTETGLDPAPPDALAEAAEIALDGGAQIENWDYQKGACRLEKSRAKVAGEVRRPAANPIAILDFANYAASTLTRAAVTRYADSEAPETVGIGAHMLRPHIAAGKAAIEAARWSGEDLGSRGVDLLVTAAIASNLLYGGNTRGGSLLAHARRSSWHQQEAHGESGELTAARKRITDVQQAFGELDRLQLPTTYASTVFNRFETPSQRQAKTQQAAAKLALRSLTEQPLPSLETYLSGKHRQPVVSA